jgi:site-specific recombinase XerD
MKLETLEKELKIRNYSQKTVKSYLFYNMKFLEFIKKSSDKVRSIDIKIYLNYLKDKGLSGNAISHIVSALKFYYEQVLGRKLFYSIRYPRREKRLPTVLTRDEIKKIIDSLKNKKHKLLIKIVYGSGLRVSEVVKLKISDLDLDKGIIHVICSKRRKDRNTILPKNLIEELNLYLKSRKDDNLYLFPGATKDEHLSIRSVQKIVKNATRLAGINKRVYVHALRHSFATHLLESGVDIKNIAELLGHNRLDTTLIYLHTSTEHLKNIRSPLDDLLSCNQQKKMLLTT